LIVIQKLVWSSTWRAALISTAGAREATTASAIAGFSIQAMIALVKKSKGFFPLFLVAPGNSGD
jgi:hypothetical protein